MLNKKGTGRTDFYYQVCGEDAFDLDQFTIICVELPGWGRSRPPARVIDKDIFENDSECCVKMMQVLFIIFIFIISWL